MGKKRCWVSKFFKQHDHSQTVYSSCADTQLLEMFTELLSTKLNIGCDVFFLKVNLKKIIKTIFMCSQAKYGAIKTITDHDISTHVLEVTGFFPE